MTPENIWLLSEFTSELIKAPMSNGDKLKEYDKFVEELKKQENKDEN